MTYFKVVSLHSKRNILRLLRAARCFVLKNVIDLHRKLATANHNLDLVPVPRRAFTAIRQSAAHPGSERIASGESKAPEGIEIASIPGVHLNFQALRHRLIRQLLEKMEP